MDDASRKAFEDKARMNYRLARRDDDKYAERDTQVLWQGWQACAAAWRERLQSEEMMVVAAIKAKVYNPYGGPVCGVVEAARSVIAAILEDVNNPNKMNTSDERVQKVDTSDTLEGWLKAQIALPVNIGDDYQRGFDNALRACLARLRTAEPLSPQHGKDIPS